MFSICTSIMIDGRTQDIWFVLRDFERYPEWNPFIRSIKGQGVVGSRIEIIIQPVGAKARTFKPTLLDFSIEKGIRWIGRLGIPLLFDGEHSFKMLDQGSGKVRFIQEETFRGIFVPFLKKKLIENTKPGFEEMNRALKTRVEKR